jgi:hypothetical protein
VYLDSGETYDEMANQYPSLAEQDRRYEQFGYEMDAVNVPPPYPAELVDLIARCMSIDANGRPNATAALNRQARPSATELLHRATAGRDACIWRIQSLGNVDENNPAVKLCFRENEINNMG